ncbi:hypothetical protein FJY68_03680 [candidate division WOR-3 bacterium]|uniref:Uncharacterized protein n=1 Tax=candidate division WOR-3 bacterium TaxID=2052148 RepID=A0A937XFY6_UNCW3|nr:hypothetical protein [candidate division WOR-3 bacterium]
MATNRSTDIGLADTQTRPGETTTTIWRPRRIGPRFRWLDHDTIKLVDGALAGREFGLTTEIQRTTAELVLTEGKGRVGEISIERNPPGKGVILSDIGVREQLRGNGLAAIMTWCAFREMVLAQETSTFRMRMASSKPSESSTDVQNVGIGVIAARLGFETEMDLEQALDPRNVTGVDIIEKQLNTPPGIRIMLRSEPQVLIAFALNADTLKPLSEDSMYVEIRKDRALMRDWALAGRLIISNANHCLRRAKAERFADVLATDAEEARLFRARVRGF